MTPRFFIDRGSATHSAAVVARVDGRWRLVDALAVPAAVEIDDLLAFLAARVADLADMVPELAHGADGWRQWQRVEAATLPAKRAALMAANERRLEALDAAATRAGWRIAARLVADRSDALETATRLVDVELDAVILAAGDHAGAEERRALAELGALAGALAGRRDDLLAVLCGAAVEEADHFPVEQVVLAPALAPSVAVSGDALVQLLLALGGQDRGARVSAARAAASLSAVLDRTLEFVDVGCSGGGWFRAAPSPDAPEGALDGLLMAPAGLVAEGDADDEMALDEVLTWSPLRLDRPTHRDRLSALWARPWHEAAGEGALLRMAAARAALARLERERVRLGWPPAERTGAPDLLVVAGGAMAVAPAPAIALAAADTLRRPGMTQVVFDHARLLAPLGMLEPGERLELLAELADDLLLPVGSLLVLAAGHPGHDAGRLHVASVGLQDEAKPLASGSLRLVELAPGATADVEVELRDGRFAGTRARRFAFQTTAGLGGLLVDTRGIPLHLPQRSERRREILAQWQRSLWPGAE